MTNRLKIRERAFVSSAVMPSLKYSCLGSSLRLTKGNTTIEGLSGNGSGCGGTVLRAESCVLREGRESYCTAMMRPRRSASPPSTKLRLDHERCLGGATMSRVWRLGSLSLALPSLG